MAPYGVVRDVFFDKRGVRILVVKPAGGGKRTLIADSPANYNTGPQVEYERFKNRRIRGDSVFGHVIQQKRKEAGLEDSLGNDSLDDVPF